MTPTKLTMRQLRHILCQLRLQGGLVLKELGSNDFIHTDRIAVVTYSYLGETLTYPRLHEGDTRFMPGMLTLGKDGRLMLDHFTFFDTGLLEQQRFCDIHI